MIYRRTQKSVPGAGVPGAVLLGVRTETTWLGSGEHRCLGKSTMLLLYCQLLDAVI